MTIPDLAGLRALVEANPNDCFRLRRYVPAEGRDE